MSLFTKDNSREVHVSELQYLLVKMLASGVPDTKENKMYVSATDTYRYLFYANGENVEYIEVGDMGSCSIVPDNLDCGLLRAQVRGVCHHSFQTIKMPVSDIKALAVDDVIYFQLNVRTVTRMGKGRGVVEGEPQNKVIPIAKKVDVNTFTILNDIPNLY